MDSMKNQRINEKQQQHSLNQSDFQWFNIKFEVFLCISLDSVEHIKMWCRVKKMNALIWLACKDCLFIPNVIVQFNPLCREWIVHWNASYKRLFRLLRYFRPLHSAFRRIAIALKLYCVYCFKITPISLILFLFIHFLFAVKCTQTTFQTLFNIPIFVKGSCTSMLLTRKQTDFTLSTLFWH